MKSKDVGSFNVFAKEKDSKRKALMNLGFQVFDVITSSFSELFVIQQIFRT